MYNEQHKLAATFKIILFGDGGAGKTALATRFLTNTFTETTKITIGCEFYIKFIDVNDKSVKLQIWDFGGEERFRFILPGYAKGAQGGLFIFDLTNRSSLYTIKSWLGVVQSLTPPFPILAVGTKVDLEEKRQVSDQEIINYLRTVKVQGYAEVSAKTGVNVDATFSTITQIMLNANNII